MTRTADRGALLLMLVTVMLWSLSWVAMKYMLLYIGPFDGVFMRNLMAFAVLLVVQLVGGRSLRMPAPGLMVAVALFQTAGMQTLCQMALVTGGAGQVSLLAYTMPFWVVLFAWMLLGDKPSGKHWVGIVLAAIGLVSVMSPWEGLGSVQGSALAVAGGASWGLGVVLAKRLFQQYQPDILTVTMWQMFLCAVLTLPLVVLVPQRAIDWSLPFWLSMIYMAVFASALGWWLWMTVLGRVSAPVASMSALGVPIMTTIFAAVLLGERPSVWDYTGIFFLFAGLVVVNSPKRRPQGRAA